MSTSIYPVPNAVIPATTTVQGIVQLAGDLGGTASSPTVVSVADVTVGTLAVTNGGTGTTTSTGSGSLVLSASPTLTGTVSGASATWTGEDKAADFKATGLTGATAASRYVGATASGAPTTGTFAVGDFIIDQTGKVYVCTVAGTPGTWVQVGATTTSVTMGGDVTGNSATSTVAKLQGVTVSTTAPTSNQVLTYNSGTTSWTPTTPSAGALNYFNLSLATAPWSGTSPYNITSQSLTAGTWLVILNAAIGSLSGGAANVDIWVGTASASTTGMVATASGGYASTASGYPLANIGINRVFTVASTTTYYVNAQTDLPSGSLKIYTAGVVTGLGSVSRVTFLQIG